MCNTLYTESCQSSWKYFSKLILNKHTQSHTHTHTCSPELDSASGQSVSVQDFFSPCLKGRVVEGVGGVGGGEIGV